MLIHLSLFPYRTEGRYEGMQEAGVKKDEEGLLPKANSWPVRSQAGKADSLVSPGNMNSEVQYTWHCTLFKSMKSSSIIILDEMWNVGRGELVCLLLDIKSLQFKYFTGVFAFSIP